MREWTAKIMLGVSLLALIYGVVSAPSREAAANTLVGCSFNKPANGDPCDGWCTFLDGANATCKKVTTTVTVDDGAPTTSSECKCLAGAVPATL